MHWVDGQTLEYADGTSVFAYVEAKVDPIELGGGWVTEDGMFWPLDEPPTRIIAILTGGLCTSYDEEPFDWGMFKSKGTGQVTLGNPVSFHLGRGTA